MNYPNGGSHQRAEWIFQKQGSAEYSVPKNRNPDNFLGHSIRFAFRKLEPISRSAIPKIKRKISFHILQSENLKMPFRTSLFKKKHTVSEMNLWNWRNMSRFRNYKPAES